MEQSDFLTIPDICQKLSGKWKLDILYCLTAGSIRWNRLVGMLPEAAPNVLTRQLRQLERDGLILRRAKNDRPPHVVEYALTEEGKCLTPALRALALWHDSFSCDNAG